MWDPETTVTGAHKSKYVQTSHRSLPPPPTSLSDLEAKYFKNIIKKKTFQERAAGENFHISTLKNTMRKGIFMSNRDIFSPAARFSGLCVYC